VEFTILGRTQLRVDQRSVDLGAAKQRGLLTLLLLNVGKPVNIEMIVEQLWPSRTRLAVQASLQGNISRLRNVLKSAGVPHELRRDPDAYRLLLDPLLIDYFRFRNWVETARRTAHQGDHLAAKRLLRNALELWPGPALVDLRSDWADNRRRQMAETDLLPARYALFDCALELREYADVLSEITPLMDDHPYDETLARQSILALAGLGRHNDVASFFARFRQRYVSEYGTGPAPDLVETYRQVLRNRESTTGPSTAKPPRSPQKLPRGLSSLTGRDDLLAVLDALLPAAGAGLPSRVVALEGMPGVGKTSVGVYWARQNLHHFPGGQLFVNLNGNGLGRLVSADDAMSRLLYDLGVPADLIPANVEQRAGKLNHLLAGRQALVFLDNVEDSAHVRPLLDAMSECLVLITSRARLSGLVIRDGVDSLTVRPLSAEDSISLLRAEIGDERASEDLAALHDLALLTAGLPLALRIVGHNVAGRPQARLTEIAQELDGHSALVTSLTDVDDEMATVPGAFSLSYNALSVATARLFRRLGLHPSPTFSAHAASALFGQDAEATEPHLKSLTAMHLLEQEGRLYRLHDLLHAYAADLTNREEHSTDRHAALTRMADWYFRTAINAKAVLAPHSLSIPAMASGTDVIPLTFENDQEAIRWCGQERSNLIATIRCAAENGLFEYAWRMPAGLWDAFERSGFKDDFLRVLPLALDATRSLGDRQAEAWMLNTLGRVHFGRRDYQPALAYFEEGLAVARQIEDLAFEAAGQHNIACVWLELGKLDAALEIYQQTLHLQRDAGARDGEAHTLHRLGDAHHRRGMPEKAIDCYRDALRIRREIRHIRGQADTLAALGKLYQGRAEYDEALDHCSRALELYEQAQDKVAAADTLTQLAAIYYDTQEFKESIRCAHQAIALSRLTQDSLTRARALDFLGRAQLATTDSAAARKSWMQALTIFETVGDPDTETVRLQLDELDAQRRDGEI
jgi:DNA-binding SARP family transcriptional activator/tetratricopeptide (TPR) repeat protein